jgi:hypothetical protein
VKVEVAGIDAEPLRELSVRELPIAFLTEHFQDANPEWVSQRLELLGLVEY